MLSSAIISRFELQVDDLTELSTTEELALLNEKYHLINAERDWNYLKSSATGSQSISVPYVTLPSDFGHVIPNFLSTQNHVAETVTSSPCVVFVGTNYQPYTIVNWSDRRQYRDQDGYAYIDPVNGRLYFTKQPTTAQTYEFDYAMIAPTLTAVTSPLIPERFQPLLWLDMAIDDDIIQRSEKARSYAPENRAKRDDIMSLMKLWDSRFQMN